MSKIFGMEAALPSPCACFVNSEAVTLEITITGEKHN